MTSDHDPLADAAVEPIEPGMTVGLGTGRTATRAIHALARRADDGLFHGVCVATSNASTSLAYELGLSVTAMETTSRVDYLFDGADEVDHNFRMIKGGGGAMTREKIVAHASKRRVYIIQERKIVDRLGTHFRVPIEVLQFALAFVRDTLSAHGMSAIVRADRSGVVLTDQEHCILDALMPADQSPEQVAGMLDEIPGIVGHGLFLNEADEFIIESEDGGVRRLTREGR